MSVPRQHRVLVIGVGNRFRGDDGVGEVVAERVRAHLGATDPAGVAVTVLDGEPTRLIDTWADAPLAVVIDAVRSGAEPGTVERIDIDPAASGGPDLPAASGGSGGTHTAGLAEALALGRALDRLPDRLVVHLVEGAEFGLGPGLSPPVAAVVDTVVAAVLGDLERGA
jgi:hydrogenase maturation protease